MTLRSGADLNDACGSVPMPVARKPGSAGIVEAVFNTMGLGTHVHEYNLPNEEEEEGPPFATWQGARVHDLAFSWEVCSIIDVSGVTGCKNVKTPKKAFATLGTVEGIKKKKLIIKNNMKALTTMREAWMLAFNDRVGLWSLSIKDQCTHLEVAGVGVLSPKSYCERAVKAWVHIPSTHPGLREVAIKEAACMGVVDAHQERNSQ